MFRLKNADAKILNLAIPNIISNISIPVLGFVDTFLMGHLDSTVYIGAVSMGAVVLNFIVWGLAFFRMSTSGLTAQAFGQNNEELYFGVCFRGIMFALFSGLFAISVSGFVSDFGFDVMGGSDEVKSLAKHYFRIRIIAAPATFSILTFSGWFLGMQRAKVPMLMLLLLNALNILLNVLFVRIIGMKSEGVAWGTVISEYVVFLAYLMVMKREFPGSIKYAHKDFLLNLKKYVPFLRISGAFFLRTVCVILVFTFFTSESAEFGNNILAANSILRDFLMFFSFFMDGFAYAAEAVVGFEAGRKYTSNLIFYVKRLFFWGILITVVITLLYLFFTPIIISLLTNQSDLIDLTLKYRYYIVLIPVSAFATFLWDGVFIGKTAGKEMLATMVISTFLIFFPVYLILKTEYNNNALWIAMLLFYLSRGVMQTLLSKRVIGI